MRVSVFAFTQELLLCLSLLCLIASMVFFIWKKYRTALFILFFSNLFMGLFMGMLDPYLNYWDEQYHALVARNMMDHPFTPMLCRNPVVGYGYEVWVGSHIWLNSPSFCGKWR